MFKGTGLKIAYYWCLRNLKFTLLFYYGLNHFFSFLCFCKFKFLAGKVIQTLYFLKNYRNQDFGLYHLIDHYSLYLLLRHSLNGLRWFQFQNLIVKWSFHVTQNLKFRDLCNSDLKFAFNSYFSFSRIYSWPQSLISFDLSQVYRGYSGHSWFFLYLF